MVINFKATNMELSAPIKARAQEKFGGLEKYFNNILQVDVELGVVTKGQQKGNIFFCEVNVSVPKKLLRYRREFESLEKAINEAKKGIQNELGKYKEQLNGK